MKLRKLLAVAVAGITAAAAMATAASASVYMYDEADYYIPEGETYPTVSGGGTSWCIQIFNEGNDAESKPKVDYGVDPTAIAQVMIVMEPGGDFADLFEGAWGGGVIFSANGGEIGQSGDELYRKYNWPSNEWWGVWNTGTYEEMSSEELKANIPSDPTAGTFATLDMTKECKTMALADGKWCLVYNVPEEDKYIAGGACYQMGIQEWGSDLAEVKVDYFILNDADGNNLLTTDGLGNPVDAIEVTPLNDYYAGPALGKTAEEMAAMEAPTAEPAADETTAADAEATTVADAEVTTALETEPAEATTAADTANSSNGLSTTTIIIIIVAAVVVIAVIIIIVVVSKKKKN